MAKSTLVVLTLAAMAIGCTQVPVNTAPSTSMRPVTWKTPVLTPIMATEDIQEKDGIRMVVTPEPFRIERVEQRLFRAVPVTFSLGENRPVDRQDVSVPDLQPEQLMFRVRISNRLGRVIRLAGSVVSFQLSGRNISVPQDNYAEFLSGIVLPRQEAELVLKGPDLVAIAGPTLDGLPGDTATVAVLLFDVVTATDAAGNPTKRANFEYFYRLRMTPRTDSIATTFTRLSLPIQWWTYIASQQQGDVNKWVRIPRLECYPNCGQE